jgi:katanin p60 ATPase-containing subunit A1
MDGLARTNDRVFVLAASNLPWELDIAILRRLEKRILINLPEKYGREAMFAACLPADSRDAHGHQVVGSLDLEKLAFLTEGTKIRIKLLKLKEKI